MRDESYADGALRVGLTPRGDYRVLSLADFSTLGVVEVLDDGYRPVSASPAGAAPSFGSLRRAVDFLAEAAEQSESGAGDPGR